MNPSQIVRCRLISEAALTMFVTLAFSVGFCRNVEKAVLPQQLVLQ
jgi:hypothetical protein